MLKKRGDKAGMKHFREIPLSQAIPAPPHTVSMRIEAGDWDYMAVKAYNLGVTIIEVDETGKPLRAFFRGTLREILIREF